MAAAERTSAGAIFSVPAGVAFLEAIASAVVAGDLPRPGGRAPAGHDLSRYLILLPTRRAARSLAEAFLKASRRRALILPDIRPIGEGDEDLGLLDGLVSGGAIGRTAAEDLPPAVGAIERRLALTRLVLAWSAALRQAEDDPGPALAGPATPAQAVRFAADLGRLIDMLERRGVISGYEGSKPRQVLITEADLPRLRGGGPG